MPLFISEPARPGLQRLSESLRLSRKREAQGVSHASATGTSIDEQRDAETQAEQQRNRAAVSSYQDELIAGPPSELAYLPVSHLAHSEVTVIDSGATLADARELMMHRSAEHLVVLHSGAIAGVIGLSWVLLKHLPQDGLKTASESPLLTQALPAFITATPETDAHELALQMLAYEIDAAVIMDDRNEATAVVSPRDFLRLFAQRHALNETI